MHRYGNGQISLTDFKQPVGMNLKESNRWVEKAQTLPWPEIEKRYAALFTNRKGNVAKPLRLALGACLIQAEYGYSDEETSLQIQENPYLQYFCGYSIYYDRGRHLCVLQYPLSSGRFPAQRGQGERRKAFGHSSRPRGRKEA